MKLKIMALLFLSSGALAAENQLSNISTVAGESLLISSEFYGYTLSQGDSRYADVVDLDGLDWAFWYGEHRFTAKQGVDLISDVQMMGEYELKNEKPAHGNEYYWEGGSSKDYLDESNHAIYAKPGGGFSFQVKPGKSGDFRLDLYTHNWLSASEFTACLNEECVTIDNFYPTSIATTQNSVQFTTESDADILTIQLAFKPDQFGWSQNDGYLSLEAINLSEGK